MSKQTNRITLFDFEDSFTYNIVSELYKLGEEVNVVSLNELSQGKGSELFPQKKHIFIYGPGPGHPTDYSKLYPFFKSYLENPLIFHLGICLGHQILWNLQGIPIRRSHHPVHGQAEEVTIPAWSEYFLPEDQGTKIKVQRYNSLTLDLNPLNPLDTLNIYTQKERQSSFAFAGGEVCMGLFPRGLTYQFHPESVGTTCPEIFFRPILKFLGYN